MCFAVAARVSVRARHKHASTTRRTGTAQRQKNTRPQRERRERGEENRRGKMSHPAPCPQTIAQSGQGRCALFSSPVWPCFFWDNVMCYALRCAGAGCPCRASALGCPRSRPIRREHGLIRDAPAALPSPPTLTCSPPTLPCSSPTLGNSLGLPLASPAPREVALCAVCEENPLPEKQSATQRPG